MSNVVAFRLDQRARAATEDDGVRGHILFFTGIRYLRDDESDAPADADPARGDSTPADDETAGERLKA